MFLSAGGPCCACNTHHTTPYPDALWVRGAKIASFVLNTPRSPPVVTCKRSGVLRAPSWTPSATWLAEAEATDLVHPSTDQY